MQVYDTELGTRVVSRTRPLCPGVVREDVVLYTPPPQLELEGATTETLVPSLEALRALGETPRRLLQQLAEPRADTLT